MNAVVPSKLSTRNVWGLFHKLGYLDNLYPINGVSSVPNEIARLITSYGGRIKINSQVDKIRVEGDQLTKVICQDKTYSGKIVVSNTGIKSTIFDLVGEKYFGSEYIKKIKKIEPTIKITSILVQLKSKPPFGESHIIGKVSNNLENANRLAEKGKFDYDAPYIMSFPSLVNPKASPQGTHCGTIQFTGDIPEKRTQELLEYVDETLFPGFLDSILWHTTLTSQDYERLINCPSYVYHTAPVLGQVGRDRPDFRLPVPNIFCVGDSVSPDFPSVMQALNSGFGCGEFINTKIGRGL
jgi:phytoene dehydrogenase-like protein